MRRALGIVLATAALLVCAAPNAGAIELKLSPWMKTAMTDNYVYWVKQHPSECKNCNQLWRTSLVDGSAAPALPSRKGIIRTLLARGSTIAITEVYKTRSKYQTRVRILNEAGGTRVLARADYHPLKSRNCGSMVGAGALSPSGELAWQRIDVPRTYYICQELPDYSRWSAHAGTIDGAARELIKPRRQSTILIYSHEALGWARPIYGFDGLRLLTAPESDRLTATDVRTNATFKYRFGNDDNRQYGDLGPGGQVVTEFYSKPLDTPVPVLFTSPMSAAPAISLRVDGYATSEMRFCGNALVQVAYNKQEIIAIRRDLTGESVSTKRFPLNRETEYPLLRCNQTQGVILYDELIEGNRIYAKKAFSFDLY